MPVENRHQVKIPIHEKVINSLCQLRTNICSCNYNMDIWASVLLLLLLSFPYLIVVVDLHSGLPPVAVGGLPGSISEALGSHLEKPKSKENANAKINCTGLRECKSARLLGIRIYDHQLQLLCEIQRVFVSLFVSNANYIQEVELYYSALHILLNFSLHNL